MLEVEIEKSTFDERLAAMQQKLAAFPRAMADELTEWQQIDMRRRFPQTDLNEHVGGESTAATSVFPRSRLELTGQDKKRSTVRSMRRRVRQATTALQRAAASMRPILRATLLEDLWQRMDVLLQTLNWRR